MFRNVPTFVIEPVALFREGLRRILLEAQFQVLRCVDRAAPNLLPCLPAEVSPLVIIAAEIDDAIDQARIVKQQYPTARAVVLTTSASQEQALKALHQGADAMILRQTSLEAFIEALKMVIAGATVLPAKPLPAVIDQQPAGDSPREVASAPMPALPSYMLPPPVTGQIKLAAPPALDAGHRFSLRENDVLELLRIGWSNKEIGRRLGLAEATVKVHVKAIFRKAGMRNRTQIALWASRLTPAEQPQPVQPF